MASRIEICKDEAEMLRMFDAGLLLVDYGYKSQKWKTAPKYVASGEWGYRYNNSADWQPHHFGYLVEDE